MEIMLLVLIVVLIINGFAAQTMYEIAAMKGHPQKKYFWWCFLMGIFGYPMVIALPDRKGATAQSVPSADELPEL